MKQYTITVDVYGKWGDVQPRYRVYLDNELMTERDFIWPGHEIYVRETILAKLKPGAHRLVVEQITAQGKIEARNVLVNGNSSNFDFFVGE